MPGLLKDLLVRHVRAVADLPPGPARHGLFDIGDLALGAFDGRLTPIFRVEIFLLVPQDFGYGAAEKKKEEKEVVGWLDVLALGKEERNLDRRCLVG